MKLNASLPRLSWSSPQWRGGFGAAAAVVVAIALAVQQGPKSGGSADVMLLYVGADDCGPCRAWQKGDGTTFRMSPEFARITYREVKSPTTFDVLKDDNWPADLRSYRDRLGRGAGVPMWLVVSKDQIVIRGFGASQWRNTVFPRIKSLLR